MDKSDLVQVYTAVGKDNAELVKSFLKSNGIEALIKGNPGPEGAILGRFGGHAPFNPWLVYVLESEAKEAKQLLEDFKKSKQRSETEE